MPGRSGPEVLQAQNSDSIDSGPRCLEFVMTVESLLGILIIGGGLLRVISVAAFSLTSVWFGSYVLALMLLFFVGVFSTMQTSP